MTTVVAAARIYKNNGWGLERQQASAPYQAPNRCFYRGSVAEVIFFEALSTIGLTPKRLKALTRIFKFDEPLILS